MTAPKKKTTDVEAEEFQAIEAIREPRAGLRTSEFWVSIAIILCATLLAALGRLDAKVWSATVGAVGAGYAIGRGLAKRSGP